MIQHRWVQGFHINANGVLFGGSTLAFVDEDCTMCASLMCKPGTKFTTAGYERVNFYKPAYRGDKLCFTYKPIHIGTSSITLFAKVIRHGDNDKIFSCIATLVAVENGKPISVEPLLLDKSLLRKDEAWEFVEHLRRDRKEYKGLE